MKLTIDLAKDFKPGQILYLEHQTSRLYAEVIQMISERNLCWVRPLALLTPVQAAPCQSSQTLNEDPERTSLALYDMRQGSDLFCPPSLFQAALDTDVISLLTRLNALESQAQSRFIGLGENQVAHSQLQEFVRYLWQSNPEVFY
jgi:hypothetical protein